MSSKQCSISGFGYWSFLDILFVPGATHQNQQLACHQVCSQRGADCSMKLSLLVWLLSMKDNSPRLLSEPWADASNQLPLVNTGTPHVVVHVVYSSVGDICHKNKCFCTRKLLAMVVRGLCSEGDIGGLRGAHGGILARDVAAVEKALA